MSAEIISLQAWRSEYHEPANRSVNFSLLLPTWPYGWLRPMLVEIDVGRLAAFGARTDNRKKAVIYHFSGRRRQRNIAP
jgi:hypothetical protein